MPASKKTKKSKPARSKKPSKARKAANTNKTDKALSPEARELKKILQRHISAEDHRRLSEAEINAMAENFMAFVRERKSGEAKIRVFNPSQKKEGYTSRHTVIMLANDDMPFLVDSISGELTRQGLSVHLLVHPILSVKRGGGAFSFTEKRERDLPRESWMYIEIDETPEARQLDAIAADLKSVLHEVRLAVNDWQAMRAKAVQTLTELPRNDVAGLPPGEREEAGNFLSWLEFDHFTFLGMRDYGVTGSGKNMRLERTPENALGILRKKMSVLFKTDDVEGNQPAGMHHFLSRKQLILVTRTHRDCVVHRTGPMDAILIKRFNDKGQLIGERLFVGLFTSSAYSELPRNIPLIRSKIDAVVEKAGLDPRSHDGKALIHILNGYPRDELFQITVDELFTTAMGILDLQQRKRLALFTRHDAFGRYVSCLIFVPREQYETRLRYKFQDILLQTLNGVGLDYNVKITEDALAQIFLMVRTRDGRIPPYDKAALERELQEAGRSWGHQLQNDLITAFTENQGLKISQRYAAAFPAAYCDSVSPAEAMSDIAFVESVMKSRMLEVNLYRPASAASNQINLKWFSPEKPLSLSAVLPLMRHMGLEVDSMLGPYEVRPAGYESSVWIQDCQARLSGTDKLDVPAIKPKFEETLLQAWNGAIESDSFNQLVLLAGLSFRETVVLRAVGKYLRQTGFAYGETLITAVLAAHPQASRLLVNLFCTRHDPDLAAASRQRKSAALEKEMGEYLNNVALPEHDAILRRYLNVIQNILRTNYFQSVKGEPKTYVSFKLDSRKLEELPLPRPMVEIFVYSPRMEGIHLRGGKVARGGIRWSDR
ncbi:MAG TPA: NAD-glutamate dehydrogenase domain-containing protein, partial [Alphaproteobacteria bacterium]|nr:NAD-glutamate dehydrogenase domain-containing protein [Alphaproteobacteria bacterium]